MALLFECKMEHFHVNNFKELRAGACIRSLNWSGLINALSLFFTELLKVEVFILRLFS